MKIETIETEAYILEQMEEAKTRENILGVHSAPSKKSAPPKTKMKGKSGRIKQYYFKTSLSSWSKFIAHEISFEEMKKLQKAGE